MVGGKGRSLAQLANLNLSVPAGFHLTTMAYRHFVDSNGLQTNIEHIINRIGQDDGMTAAQAAIEIQALFAAGSMPADIWDALQKAYAKLGKVPVAVRSSATAEDLPDMSFAGQQDSYLNVVGGEGVETAVLNCWASLWTARAISYRQRMGIDHHAVAMGVVVQKMVPADVSGILFTANPTTGNRDEMVINASYGLGEAIVGGLITPDTYLIDRTSGDIQET
ncbi:MAG: pyruvate, phosphate dikinase, partial [Ketobacter sp.]|nr:pyruvate, phosphate dikinase [Ketobacter sp.]